MRLQERRPRKRHVMHEDVIESPQSAGVYMHKRVIGGTSPQNTFDRAINTRIPFSELNAVDFESPKPFLIGKEWCQSFIPEHYEPQEAEILTESKHRRNLDNIVNSLVEDYGFPDKLEGDLPICGIMVPFLWEKDDCYDYVLVLMEPADCYVCYTVIGCDREGDSIADTDCDTILL